MTQDLKPSLNWPERLYGADVLVGFSHQEMGSDDPDPPDPPTIGNILRVMSEGESINDNIDWGSYADAVSHPRVVLVGTNDVTRHPSGWISLLFTHEMGHVYEAEHPPDLGGDVPPDTPGVMCKNSCGIDVVNYCVRQCYL